MKSKKFLSILALALAFTSLAGCTQGDQTVDFIPYWEDNYIAGGGQAFTEELTYAVTYEKGESTSLVGYTLSYGNGTYTTKLQSNGTQYEYTTTLQASVTYTVGESSKTVDELVTSSVTFESAKNGLKPVKSEKRIKGSTPANTSEPTKAEDCFFTVDYKIQTVYGDSNQCTVTKNPDGENKAEKTYKIKKDGKLSYLDNEQLPLALRAISPSVTSAKIQTYSPFSVATQTASVTFGEEEETMHKLTVSLNGEEPTEKNFTYRIAQMSLATKPTGVTSRIWVSTKAEDRNLILQMYTPLSYSLGELVYTLKSIDRA